MSEIQITFLGTGTSHGIPVIGCDCAVCHSQDPRDKRTRCSVHIKTPECSWVIDTGPEFRTQCLREKIAYLDAIFYTHPHTDHVMGFDDVRRFCEFRGGSIPIYGSQATLEAIATSFHFAFSKKNPPPGYVLPEPMVIDGPLDLQSTTIVPVPIQHGQMTCTGYLFVREGRKRFAYLTDCNSVPESSLELIDGVDTLVIDALRYRSHPTHMTIDQSLEVAKKVGARRTWFTHLCHEIPHSTTSESLPDGVDLAHDGLKLSL